MRTTMIIIFSDTDINRRAEAALLANTAQQTFTLEDISTRATAPLDIDPDDDTLSIIDLNANGNLQKMYAPDVMARRLYAVGLLEHITTIQLLVSDIEPTKSMLAFATELSRSLMKQNPEANIKVRVLAEVMACTLIEPPQMPQENWTLYTGSNASIKNPPSKEGAAEYYKSKMTPLFTGAIEEIFQNRDYEISPEKIRATYGTGEDSEEELNSSNLTW